MTRGGKNGKGSDRVTNGNGNARALTLNRAETALLEARRAGLQISIVDNSSPSPPPPPDQSKGKGKSKAGTTAQAQHTSPTNTKADSGRRRSKSARTRPRSQTPACKTRQTGQTAGPTRFTDQSTGFAYAFGIHGCPSNQRVAFNKGDQVKLDKAFTVHDKIRKEGRERRDREAAKAVFQSPAAKAVAGVSDAPPSAARGGGGRAGAPAAPLFDALPLLAGGSPPAAAPPAGGGGCAGAPAAPLVDALPLLAGGSTPAAAPSAGTAEAAPKKERWKAVPLDVTAIDFMNQSKSSFHNTVKQIELDLYSAAEERPPAADTVNLYLQEVKATSTMTNIEVLQKEVDEITMALTCTAEGTAVHNLQAQMLKDKTAELEKAGKNRPDAYVLSSALTAATNNWQLHQSQMTQHSSKRG